MKKVLLMVFCFCAVSTAVFADISNKNQFYSAGVSIPLTSHLIDGEKTSGSGWDFDLQWRVMEEKNTVMFFEFGIGPYFNDDFNYVKEDDFCLNVNVLGGYGKDLINKNDTHLIVSGIAGIDFISYNEKWSDTKYECTLEHDIFGVFAGADVMFASFFSENVGFYCQLTGYAGIGFATRSYSEKNRYTDSEDKNEDYFSNSMMTIAPKLGFVFRL